MKAAFPRILAAGVVALLTLSPDWIYACSVCYGDPSSPLVIGAKYGVIVLAAVVYAVLLTMGAIAFVWYRRAQALEAADLSEPDAV